jgi:hypothetical protein
MMLEIPRRRTVEDQVHLLDQNQRHARPLRLLLWRLLRALALPDNHHLVLVVLLLVICGLGPPPPPAALALGRRRCRGRLAPLLLLLAALPALVEISGSVHA